MSNQIFKKQIPNELLFNLLEVLCIKNDKYYLFTTNSFKKGIYTQLINQFLEDCKPHYHVSKHKYLERKLTHNNFTTVLRQICNFNQIKYTSEIKYDKSKYDIIYYIHF